MLVVLFYLVIVPLYRMLETTLTYQEKDIFRVPDAEVGTFTWFHYLRMFTSNMAKPYLYDPLVHSMVISVGATGLSFMIGGLLAWMCIRTDMPGRMPVWVIILCAGMIGLGTLIGGWKLIRTLGGKFFKIRPVDGFASQLSSAAVIITASLFGGPVSTTQVVSSSIMGVGAAERLNKVRWGVAQEIAMAWLLTIPATALVGAGAYWLLSSFIPG
jgi:phosphate/sulfate permease